MLKSWLAKKSLRSRLVLFLMILASLSTVVTSFVFSAYELRTANKSESHRIQSIADILAPSLTASILFDDKETARELISPLKAQIGIVGVAVYKSNGDIFLMDTPQEPGEETLSDELNTIRTPLILENTNHGRLVIWSDNAWVNQRVDFYMRVLAVMLTITLAISFITSLFLSRIFTQPIVSLANIANRVTRSNDYTLRANSNNQGELGDLTQCFNSMLETIEHRDQILESQVRDRTNKLEITNNKLKDLNEQLKEQAYNDPLSGLPNRRYLLEHMGNLIHEVEIIPFSIMYLDLDGFKDVNDSLGHDVGDKLISLAATRIKNALRKHDLLARLGGDEFTVLLDGISDTSVLVKIAENIQRELSTPFWIKGELIRITTSIGISCYPEAGSSVDEIMKKADLAMYNAKESGRNTYRFFEPPMLEKIQNKRRMLEDLRRAINEKEFELHYQPIINLATGRIDKAEALIRWNHPQLGCVSPAEFIPLAEESGLINAIGSWVAEEAIMAVKEFRNWYEPELKIAINVSPIQFNEKSNWLTHFQQCMEQSGIEKSAISIEITEHLLMASDEHTVSKLMQLEASGTEIAIDDFGVGYSSLSYLQKLKTDILKIDRSFIQSLEYDLASNTLCKTIITMAKNLNMKVVAEGIETREQKDLLTKYGCHYGQGFYYSKPISHAEFEGLLQQKLIVA